MYTHPVFIYTRRHAYRRGAMAFHDDVTRAEGTDEKTTSAGDEGMHCCVAHYTIVWEASKLRITLYQNGLILSRWHSFCVSSSSTAVVVGSTTHQEGGKRYRKARTRKYTLSHKQFQRPGDANYFITLCSLGSKWLQNTLYRQLWHSGSALQT